jgi:hypothetical protein
MSRTTYVKLKLMLSHDKVALVAQVALEPISYESSLDIADIAPNDEQPAPSSRLR